MTAQELSDVRAEIRVALERALADIISVEYAGGMEHAMSIVEEAFSRLAKPYSPNVEHDFVGDECDCALCGEGWCHYLHDQHRARTETP